MKRCLHCNASFDSEHNRCPACGQGPSEVDGFVAYASALARGGGGFKAHYYTELARMEGENFWFRARNALILWAIQKYCAPFQSFLEIGCGTAYVLSGVAAAYPRARLSGSEIFVAGLGFAAERLPAADFVQMDAREIPYRDEFDVIGAFDVIEHIEEDERVLSQMHAALKPGGHILLTVPQHSWLWSDADEYACHVRRYNAAELHRKVEAAGFKLLRSTSFVSALLPAMMASRLARRKSPGQAFDPVAEFNIPPWLNATLETILGLERGLIRAGVRLPIGGSRLVVARKSS
ncbi:class I SAM-dependent methyltransferase [Variovorax arabinosiphilus]|uniref:class I SAM-dependent methyltransferase n=1 Tax=Variovorax arabinosiphilus TaxID=3053498 RepID=UPI002578C99E|nr:MULTISPECIES: methyltransferase domain-containing protein [unclassified Variovorax]MDM0122293.1 methyltransferase domain-containing protein [Variovorax sp. J2L1-78]MDM0131178.1 methyltransferase domain-containing protein [Variovorax sp. J2L1-63]MDM0235056.1 methyltransferase domain-containing protein [Variovorax sp. J2R1-6]